MRLRKGSVEARTVVAAIAVIVFAAGAAIAEPSGSEPGWLVPRFPASFSFSVMDIGAGGVLSDGLSGGVPASYFPIAVFEHVLGFGAYAHFYRRTPAPESRVLVEPAAVGLTFSPFSPRPRYDRNLFFPYVFGDYAFSRGLEADETAGHEQRDLTGGFRYGLGLKFGGMNNDAGADPWTFARWRGASLFPLTIEAGFIRDHGAFVSASFSLLGYFFTTVAPGHERFTRAAARVLSRPADPVYAPLVFRDSLLERRIVEEQDLDKSYVPAFAADRFTEWDFAESELEEFPVDILQFSNTERIDLRDNEIREIPSGTARLARLREILVAGNPIETVSWELQAKLPFLRTDSRSLLSALAREAQLEAIVNEFAALEAVDGFRAMMPAEHALTVDPGEAVVRLAEPLRFIELPEFGSDTYTPETRARLLRVGDFPPSFRPDVTTRPEDHDSRDSIIAAGAVYLRGTVYPVVVYDGEEIFGIDHNLTGQIAAHERFSLTDLPVRVPLETDVGPYWIEIVDITRARDGYALEYRSAAGALAMISSNRALVLVDFGLTGYFDDPVDLVFESDPRRLDLSSPLRFADARFEFEGTPHLLYGVSSDRLHIAPATSANERARLSWRLDLRGGESERVLRLGSLRRHDDIQRSSPHAISLVSNDGAHLYMPHCVAPGPLDAGGGIGCGWYQLYTGAGSQFEPVDPRSAAIRRLPSAPVRVSPNGEYEFGFLESDGSEFAIRWYAESELWGYRNDVDNDAVVVAHEAVERLTGRAIGRSVELVDHRGESSLVRYSAHDGSYVLAAVTANGEVASTYIGSGTAYPRILDTESPHRVAFIRMGEGVQFWDRHTRTSHQSNPTRGVLQVVSDSGTVVSLLDGVFFSRVSEDGTRMLAFEYDEPSSDVRLHVFDLTETPYRRYVLNNDTRSSTVDAAFVGTTNHVAYVRNGRIWIDEHDLRVPGKNPVVTPDGRMLFAYKSDDRIARVEIDLEAMRADGLIWPDAQPEFQLTSRREALRDLGRRLSASDTAAEIVRELDDRERFYRGTALEREYYDLSFRARSWRLGPEDHAGRVALITDYLERDPKRADLRRDLAHALMQIGDHSRAQEEYGVIIENTLSSGESGGDSLSLHGERAALNLLILGKPAEALELLHAVRGHRDAVAAAAWGKVGFAGSTVRIEVPFPQHPDKVLELHALHRLGRADEIRKRFSFLVPESAPPELFLYAQYVARDLRLEELAEFYPEAWTDQTTREFAASIAENLSQLERRAVESSRPELHSALAALLRGDTRTKAFIAIYLDSEADEFFRSFVRSGDSALWRYIVQWILAEHLE